MGELKETYQLDECLDWIVEHNFKRVVIELKKGHLKVAPQISAYLQDNFKERINQTTDGKINSNKELDVYVTQANTCCVDLMVTQHVSNVDAIIHLGQVCLSMPHLKKQQVVQPILLAFTHPQLTEAQLSANLRQIEQEIQNLKTSQSNCRLCIFYDTDLIDYAIKLQELYKLDDSIEVARLQCPDPNWYTTPSNHSMFMLPSAQSHTFGHFILSRGIDDFNCAIYLGDRLSFHLILGGPSKLVKLSCKDVITVEQVNVSKVLNKRMALVSRLKDQDELKIGVLITNPLPNMDEITPRLRSYAEPRKHTLYFITMIQTIDECKVGNFDLCDAFIVINSCTCSTILESLVFNRPILNELEFKLVCGLEAEYGRVLWPGSSSHLSVDDMINQRRVSDVSLALMHTRNELLERCSQARLNKWSGLEYKASGGDDVSGGNSNKTGESLTIQEGLTGIASSYVSEPLKKEQP